MYTCHVKLDVISYVEVHVILCVLKKKLKVKSYIIEMILLQYIALICKGYRREKYQVKSAINCFHLG